MLSPNEIEKQLTQRRLDAEAKDLQIKQLQTQINQLQQTIKDLPDNTAGGGNSVSTLNTGGDITFTGLIKFIGSVTFSKVATFLTGLIAPIISPSADSTTAIKLTKADKTTAVMTVDTTNKRVGINTTPSKALHIISGATGNSFILDNGVAGDISMAFRSNGSNKAFAGWLSTAPIGFAILNLNGGATPVFSVGTNPGTDEGNTVLGIVGCSIGFFGATAASKQTLNAYTTNSQASSYTSTPGSLGVAATLADLNTLRVAYENLRASYDDLRTKIKTSTLVG